MGVLAYSPLAGGWLSGKYRTGQEVSGPGSPARAQRFARAFDAPLPSRSTSPTTCGTPARRRREPRPAADSATRAGRCTPGAGAVVAAMPAQFAEMGTAGTPGLPRLLLPFPALR
jgi:hypothetical protein